MIRIHGGASALLALALLASNVALSRNIYVSTSGKDANPGTSLSAPLRTVAAASRLALPGDTVQILPGRYFEPIAPVRSGRSGAPITYRSYGPAPTILTHSSINGLKSAIAITGRTYIVIDGIHVDGVRPGPAAVVRHFATILDSSHIVIRNGTFRHANGWHGIGIQGTSAYVTIERNRIDSVGQFDDGGEPTRGYGDLLVATAGTSYILIQRNTLRHGPHNLIATKCTRCIVQDNHLDNSYRDWLGGDAGGRTGQILGSRAIFQRNYVTGSGPSADRATNGLLKIEGRDNIARGNVFAYGHQEGILTEAGSWSPSSTLGRVYQNTFYRLGSAAWRMRYYPDGAQAIGGFAFVNNLVVDSRLKPFDSGSDSDLLFAVKGAGLGPTARSAARGNLVVPAAGKTPIVRLVGFDGAVSLQAAQQRYPSLFSGNRTTRPSFASLSLQAVSDFDLQPGSRGVDEGVFLTQVVGSGRSNRLKVRDHRYFTDGFGLVPGDLIQLQGSDARARISAIDTSTGVLTLGASIHFQDGQGVALAYEGSAPDVGARELTSGGTSRSAVP